MRLGVSPGAASTTTGVFNQWFEALFPRAVVLGCTVFFSPLLAYLYVNVGLPAPPVATSPSLPAAVLPTLVLQPLPCCESISAPPTGLDECVFFNSLVVRLPYSLIFCQFWLFLNCCPSFGCARRHSVSIYASILAGSAGYFPLSGT